MRWTKRVLPLLVAALICPPLTAPAYHPHTALHHVRVSGVRSGAPWGKALASFHGPPIWFALPAGSHTTTITTTGAGTFTVPSLAANGYDVTSLLIYCWGSGGGGRVGSVLNSGGGGGGAGFSQTTALTVTPGQVLNVFISAGGVAGSVDGSVSWVSTTSVAPTSTAQGCLANGGKSAPAAPNGGVGAVTTGAIGDVKQAGGAGGTGVAGGGGGGGGSGGGGGDGGAASGITGGAAGSGTPVGIAGSNGSLAGNGVAGNPWGGGASGGGTPSGTAATGARGEIRIIYAEIFYASGAPTLSLSVARGAMSVGIFRAVTLTPTVAMVKKVALAAKTVTLSLTTNVVKSVLLGAKTVSLALTVAVAKKVIPGAKTVSLTLTTNAVKNVGLGAKTASLTLTTAFARAITGARSFNASLALTTAFARSVVGARSFSASLTLTTASQRLRAMFRTFAAFLGGPVVTDSFNRADGVLGTADTGQVWSNLFGPNWTIVSNKANPANTDAATMLDTALTDFEVETKIDTTLTAGSSGINVGFAPKIVDSSNYLYAVLYDGAQVILGGNASPSIGQVFSAGGLWTPGDTVIFQLRFVGPTYTAYINGKQVATKTLSGAELTKFGSMTRLGLYSGGPNAFANNTNVTVDDLLVVQMLHASYSRLVAAARSFSANLTLSAAFARLIAAARSFNVSLTLTTAMSRAIVAARSFTASLSLSAVMARSIVTARFFSVTLGLSAAYSRFIAAARSFSATLNLDVAYSRFIAASRSFSASLSLSTNFDRFITTVRNFATTITLRVKMFVTISQDILNRLSGGGRTIIKKIFAVFDD